MIFLTEKQKTRFWSKVDIQGDNDCWEWQKGLNRLGYGVFTVTNSVYTKPKDLPAHRASAYLAGMDIEGLCVCHTCDNPKCVNPNHFFLGTQGDNQADKIKKGRQLKGLQLTQTKLSEEQVREIRSLYAQGMKRSTLAKKYNISWTQIDYIVKRKNWTHI